MSRWRSSFIFQRKSKKVPMRWKSSAENLVLLCACRCHRIEVHTRGFLLNEQAIWEESVLCIKNQYHGWELRSFPWLNWVCRLQGRLLIQESSIHFKTHTQESSIVLYWRWLMIAEVKKASTNSNPDFWLSPTPFSGIRTVRYFDLAPWTRVRCLKWNSEEFN
jgi:hypothetical protein